MKASGVGLSCFPHAPILQLPANISELNRQSVDICLNAPSIWFSSCANDPSSSVGDVARSDGVTRSFYWPKACAFKNVFVTRQSRHEGGGAGAPIRSPVSNIILSIPILGVRQRCCCVLDRILVRHPSTRSAEATCTLLVSASLLGKRSDTVK